MVRKYILSPWACRLVPYILRLLFLSIIAFSKVTLGAEFHLIYNPASYSSSTTLPGAGYQSDSTSIAGTEIIYEDPAQLGSRITVHTNLRYAQVGDVFLFQPDAITYRIDIEKRVALQDGDVTFYGKIEDTDTIRTTTLTVGKIGCEAIIDTPEGKYLIRQDKYGEKLVTPHHQKSFQRLPIDSGGVILPYPKIQAFSTTSSLPGAGLILPISSAQKMAQQVDTSTIDLLVVWDEEFENGFINEAAAKTHINNIIAFTNQVFVRSGIDIQINLVHARQVAYPNSVNMVNTLNALRLAQDNFYIIPYLRALHQADAVTFIRNYSPRSHGGTLGRAYVLGRSGSMLGIWRISAFSVVADARNISDNYFTIPHELGHNLGSTHDHDTSDPPANGYPIFDYSYGHKVSGTNGFGTIMSYFYDDDKENIFSNPNIQNCGPDPSNQACGVTSGTSAANNHLGFNNIRSSFASFYPDPLAIKIALAVESPELIFANFGNGTWRAENSQAPVGSSSARSTPLDNEKIACLQTNIDGPGKLSFYWKVSSEVDYDFLNFTIQSASIASLILVDNGISGIVDWTQKIHEIGFGNYNLTWCYTKDQYIAKNVDAAWVDGVDYQKISSISSVTASLGIFADRIEISWNSITAASSYEVYRSTNTNGSFSHISTTTAPFFSDTSAILSVEYFYQVRACGQETTNSTIICTEPSATVVGHALFPPQNVTASRGTFDDEVRVNWSASALAASYRIFRSPSANNSYVQLATTQGIFYRDISASPGTSYDYQIETCLASLCSARSSSTTGYRTAEFSVAEAINSSQISVLNPTSIFWFGQGSIYQSSPAAAQSGIIGDSEQTCIKTQVLGAGGLSFYWKVSSQMGEDFLRFFIDGNRQNQISGVVDWQQKTYTLTGETTTLLWCYMKNANTSSGSDAGWVDTLTTTAEIANDVVISSRVFLGGAL